MRRPKLSARAMLDETVRDRTSVRSVQHGRRRSRKKARDRTRLQTTESAEFRIADGCADSELASTHLLFKWKGKQIEQTHEEGPRVTARVVNYVGHRSALASARPRKSAELIRARAETQHDRAEAAERPIGAGKFVGTRQPMMADALPRSGRRWKGYRKRAQSSASVGSCPNKIVAATVSTLRCRVALACQRVPTRGVAWTTSIDARQFDIARRRLESLVAARRLSCAVRARW